MLAVRSVERCTLPPAAHRNPHHRLQQQYFEAPMQQQHHSLLAALSMARNRFGMRKFKSKRLHLLPPSSLLVHLFLPNP